MNTRSRTVLPPRTEQGSIMMALMLSIALILLSFIAMSVLVKRNTQTRLTNASQQSQTGIDAGTAFAIDQIHGLPAHTCMGVPQTIPASWQNTASTDGGMFRWWADCSELAKGKITATVEAQTADTKFTNPKLAQLCFTWVPTKGYKITCRVSSDAHTPVPPPTPPPACSTISQPTVSVPSGLLAYNPVVTYSPSGQLYLVGSIYIRRYNTDYTPDASWNFDSTGLDIGSTLGIFPLTNGRVLVWGNRSNSPWAAILNNDGSINKTLALNYSVRRAAEGSDGSFYLNQSAWGAIISKYSADGEVDTSFASTIALNFPSFETVNFAVIPSGKYAGQILVSGRQTIESRQYGTLLRFNSDGTLNRRLISIRDTWVQSFAHDTNTNSNLYTLSSGWHISVGRIDENGDPDRTFNNGGANPLLLGDSRGVGEHLEIRTIVRDRFGRYYLAGIFGNPQHVTYDGVSARGAGFMSPGTGGSPMWVIDDNGTLDRQWGTRIFNDCTTATHGFNVRDAIGGGYWRPNGLSIAVSPGGDRITIVAAGAGKFAGLLPYAGSMDYPTGFGDSAGLYLFRDDGVPSKVG